MLVPTQVKVSQEVYAGLKFLERTKAIPYADLRDGKAVVQHAQKLRLTKVAQWVVTHPYDYENGSRNKSFCVED
jgi:hypothetical protein